jgi:hypothetical protein
MHGHRFRGAALPRGRQSAVGSSRHLMLRLTDDDSAVPWTRPQPHNRTTGRILWRLPDCCVSMRADMLTKAIVALMIRNYDDDVDDENHNQAHHAASSGWWWFSPPSQRSVDVPLNPLGTIDGALSVMGGAPPSRSTDFRSTVAAVYEHKLCALLRMRMWPASCWFLALWRLLVDGLSLFRFGLVDGSRFFSPDSTWAGHTCSEYEVHHLGTCEPEPDTGINLISFPMGLTTLIALHFLRKRKTIRLWRNILEQTKQDDTPSAIDSADATTPQRCDTRSTSDARYHFFVAVVCLLTLICTFLPFANVHLSFIFHDTRASTYTPAVQQWFLKWARPAPQMSCCPWMESVYNASFNGTRLVQDNSRCCQIFVAHFEGAMGFLDNIVSVASLAAVTAVLTSLNTFVANDRESFLAMLRKHQKLNSAHNSPADSEAVDLSARERTSNVLSQTWFGPQSLPPAGVAALEGQLSGAGILFHKPFLTRDFVR